MAKRRGNQIVYTVVTNPGGVDGMDHTDKGGIIRFASFDGNEADGKVDAWSKVEPKVVNLDDARKEALGKLTPLDRLVLGL